ncbi:MAG TPA: hypothetical protein VN947_15025 [Polyangia bacterium]|nr:hypothetical protein [Polyangia bacterium]
MLAALGGGVAVVAGDGVAAPLTEGAVLDAAAVGGGAAAGGGAAVGGGAAAGGRAAAGAGAAAGFIPGDNATTFDIPDATVAMVDAVWPSAQRASMM